MSRALASAMPQARLPQFRGRWVVAYQAIWCILALASAGLFAASLIDPVAHPAILALRFVKSVIVICVSAILLRRRRNDPVAALLALAFLIWTITSSVDFASAGVLPMLLDRVRFLLFALALLLFPDGHWRPRWTRSVAVASVGTFLLGVVEGVGILPTRLFLPVAIGCVIAAIAALIARYRATRSEAVRQQLKWVALGLISGIGLILLARAGAALAGASPRLRSMPILFEAMFQLGIVAVALGFLVSLLRYRLFDAETAISRSAAFAGLTVAVVATFAGTEAMIEWLGQQYLGMGIGNISAAMAAAVAAVLLNPLHSRISEWAENRFQHDLVLLKRQLPQVIAEVSAGASASQLGSAVLPHINVAIHATRSTLLVNGKVIAALGIAHADARRWARNRWRHDRPLGERCDDDPQFPIRLPLHSSLGANYAWLVIGPRPDGSLYGSEELDALRSVMPELLHALMSTIARDAFHLGLKRSIGAARKEIVSLRDRLSSLEDQPQEVALPRPR